MDIEFLQVSLAEYFNQDDLTLLQSALKNAAAAARERRLYNQRTGRRFVFTDNNRRQRVLRPASKRNYESTLKKFGRFKLREVGRDAPLTADLVERYNRYLNGEEANLKYQTRLTNVRTLNKYIVVPILDQEMPLPRVAANVPRNNKPKFPSTLIWKTVNQVWNHCTSSTREHAHKLKLIYHTGLRGAELQNLTYRTIFDSCSFSPEKIAIIKVVNGKNGRERNVPLFGGDAIEYYFDVLLPYVQLNFQTEYYNRHKDREGEEDLKDEILKMPIFTSPYQNTHKIFRRALRKILLQHEPPIPHLEEAIKGAGLHSIRADYATRGYRFLSQLLKDSHQASGLMRDILGHSRRRTMFAHYINQGGDIENNTEPGINSSLFDNIEWGNNVRTVRDRPFIGRNTNMMRLFREEGQPQQPAVFVV